MCVATVAVTDPRVEGRNVRLDNLDALVQLRREELVQECFEDGRIVAAQVDLQPLALLELSLDALENPVVEVVRELLG